MFPRLRTAVRPTSLPVPKPCPPTSFAPRAARPHPRFASSSSNAPASAFNAQKNETRSRPFVYVLGLIPIFTFGLGTWQIQRLKWKLDMIDQLENKLNKDTVRLPARIDPAAIPEFAYRKVFLTGTFDHEHEILLGPRTREGELGFHVITPLVRGDGADTIMVDRGFVKRAKKDKAERPEALTNEPVEVVGMLRDQDKSNSFTPANSPDKEEWVFANIEQMAAHTGAEPVLVDEIYSGNGGQINMRLSRGVPVGRAATVELRNQHVTYAVTWYALSLATAFMFFRLVKAPSKRISASQFRGVG